MSMAGSGFFRGYVFDDSTAALGRFAAPELR
jgi:hypothetical protein